MRHQGLHGRTAAIPWHVPSIASYNTYAFPLAPIDATTPVTDNIDAPLRSLQALSVVSSIPLVLAVSSAALQRQVEVVSQGRLEV